MRAFKENAQFAMFSDGRRLSLRHGPIDIIAEVISEWPGETARIYETAFRKFTPILPGLCEELDTLRRAVSSKNPRPASAVGKRMHDAARLFSPDHFVTPMISVAGSVADHLLDQIKGKAGLRKAYFNNGGDIALYLADGEVFEVGICSNLGTGDISARVSLNSHDEIGGIATSGWQGRSHSLGIADAVTVFARNAATADAAATLIANATDVKLPQSIVKRVPAHEISPDSDLENRLVTVEVGALSAQDKERALTAGLFLADKMVRKGLIHSAYLSLQGQHAVAGVRNADTRAALDLPLKPLNEKGMIYAAG